MMRYLMTVLALCAAATLAPACDGDVFETEHAAVEEGNEALASGKAGEAKQKYDEAAAELPASPELDYVTGLALSEAGDHHKATQALIRALSTKDDVLLQKVRAALGLAYCRWGLDKEKAEKRAGDDSTAPKANPQVTTPKPDDDKDKDDKAAADPDAPPDWKSIDLWEKAVDQLERALVMKPDDTESMRNLEVALLRVDPPCSARDDANEVNNTIDKATPIQVAAEQAPTQSGAPQPKPGAGKDELEWKGEALMSCPDDVDYYKIDLDAGDRLAVGLKGGTDAGRVGLVLLGPDGKDQLRPPAGTEEPLQALEYSVGSGKGTYFLRVDNVDGDEVPYELDVKVRPPCRKTEDRFEENDGPESAQNLTPGTVDGLKLCPLDPDWYKVTLGEGESLMVTVALQGDSAQKDASSAAKPNPPFSLDVAAVLGEAKASGVAFGNTRVATLFTPGPGDYTIAVKGLPQLEQRYELTVHVVPPCDQDGDDTFEDNDIVEDATDLEAKLAEMAQQQGGGQPGQGGAQQGKPPVLSLRICPDDADWFKITARPEERKQLTAVFEHAKGDLSMRLYNADGTEEVAVADESSDDRNGEALAIPEVKEETVYTVKIQGPKGVENFYQLKLDQPQNNNQNQQNQDNDDKQDQQDQDDKQDQKDQQDKQDQKDQQDKKDQQDQQDKKDQKDQQDDRRQQQQQQRKPMDDKLDKLDHNPKNLEAEKARRTSPLANHPPRKDW